MTTFDSRTPARGVLVMPVPRARMHVTHTQAKNMRILTHDFSVMQAKPLCQPIKTSGGGLPPAMVVVKGDTKSTNHRRRSPKMRPHNRCFGGPLPSMSQTILWEARQHIERMRRLYVRIVRVANLNLDRAYEALRRSFKVRYYEHMGLLLKMEAQVEGVSRA